MKLTETTKSIKVKNITRSWHLVDLRNKVLGRVVPGITEKLQGKHKASYVDYLDSGDYVVAINAKYIVLTGRKSKTKTYTQYSGYPGGLKIESFSELIKKNPKKIIERAVSGMLPKNKFRTDRLRRLYIFEDNEHTFKDKFNKS